jgi:methyl-accepting chemotaxis protein
MSSEVAETSVATDQARASVQEIAQEISFVKFMMQATASSLVVQAASTRDMTGRLAHVENVAGSNLQTAQGLRSQIDQLVNAAGSLEHAVSAA